MALRINKHLASQGRKPKHTDQLWPSSLFSIFQGAGKPDCVLLPRPLADWVCSVLTAAASSIRASSMICPRSSDLYAGSPPLLLPCILHPFLPFSVIGVDLSICSSYLQQLNPLLLCRWKTWRCSEEELHLFKSTLNLQHDGLCAYQGQAPIWKSG